MFGLYLIVFFMHTRSLLWHDSLSASFKITCELTWLADFSVLLYLRTCLLNVLFYFMSFKNIIQTLYNNKIVFTY